MGQDCQAEGYAGELHCAVCGRSELPTASLWPQHLKAQAIQESKTAFCSLQLVSIRQEHYS